MLQHEMPSGPSRPPVDHDKAAGYRNSVAWRDMKKLYGQQFFLDRLFAGMERLYACSEVRLFLANALHHWLNLSPAEREKAFHEFTVYRAEQTAVQMAEQGHVAELDRFELWRREYERRHALDAHGRDWTPGVDHAAEDD
jgi:hypothetical protein